MATLYYRNDPILCGSVPSKAAYSDEGFLRGIWRSALIADLLNRAGIPDIQGVYSPPVAGSRYLDIISIKQRYDGHAADAGHVASAFFGRYIVIVDDDIVFAGNRQCGIGLDNLIMVLPSCKSDVIP